MSKDLEDFTIFLIKFGIFKYLVMPLSFYNSLASWQHFINYILSNFLLCFIQVYLDDIFIYCKTLKEHYSHVCQTLQRLQEAGLQAKIDKCEFHIQVTKFFDLIVSTKDIQIDLQKV